MAVAAVTAALLLAACSDGGAGAAPDVDASAVAQREAAQQWADGIDCPTDVAALERAAATAPAPAALRPGLERSLLPAGDVTAVVRCGVVRRDSVYDVVRTVVLDAQPLSWFSDGDHFRTRSFSTSDLDTTTVVVHYASGPDVTVHTAHETEAVVQRNGAITCRTASRYDGTAVVTCSEGPDLDEQRAFVPASAPPAAGAPPVDCPTGAEIDRAAATLTAEPSPRPEASSTPVPADDAVVMVVCSNGGSRFELWGEQADAVLRPTVTRTGVARCLSLAPPCMKNTSVTYVGYRTGAPVVATAWEDGTGPREGWLIPPDPHVGAGTANGVLACRYREEPDTLPRTLLGCLPLDVARTARPDEPPTVAVAGPTGSASVP